jgi:hypothetical protein
MYLYEGKFTVASVAFRRLPEGKFKVVVIFYLFYGIGKYCILARYDLAVIRLYGLGILCGGCGRTCVIVIGAGSADEYNAQGEYKR